MQDATEETTPKEAKVHSLERLVTILLLGVAVSAVLGGGLAFWAGRGDFAAMIWMAGTVPVALSLLVSILRAFFAGRVGVDAIALVSMSGALALGEMLAAIVVAVMYAGGTVLEDFAVARAERDLRGLVDRAPRVAHLVGADGVRDVPVDDVNPGDVVLVKAGEVVPVDGTVEDTTAVIDESALTGEPIPVNRPPGASVLSGTVNAGASFRITARATANESAYAGIIRMVSSAQTAKAPFIRAADRFAIILLPVTLLVAGLAWYLSGDPLRGLAVLVVATPCPLILAAPVAFIGGVSRAARRGILIKGGGPLEALAQVRTVLFDKTGTLTLGGARMIAIETAPEMSEDHVLGLAASLDQASHHVVAEAIVDAARQRKLSLSMPQDVVEAQGEGISGTIGGQAVRVGSQAFALGDQVLQGWSAHALRRAQLRSSLAVFVAVDGAGIGAILMGDEIRSDASRTIRALRAKDVTRIVMLTGDRADTAQSIGTALSVDEVLAERTPAQKVQSVADEQSRAATVMVGDGINDAPALAAASVGIAMGVRGASAASQAADVVILVDQIDRVADAIGIARRTRKIALQSMTVGLSLSGIAMIAAAFGWLTPVQGALTQEAIDVAVILNALRTLVPGRVTRRVGLTPARLAGLRTEHKNMEPALDRLSDIADILDVADAKAAKNLISEANGIVSEELLAHERSDETGVFAEVRPFLSDDQQLIPLSRTHDEIKELSGQLSEMSDAVESQNLESHLIGDAQRVIETLVTLCRIHNAQEEDIYDSVAAE
ncbi:heavy metal translocating P-type ATPase [Puniceibacterium sediminis]|uniref:P-type Zn(2+) transporter n=1 Tax=Puniceibacterium sediminis TaxID=1608407 RepID=A0A238ZNG5_9RHOB|nr:heavy metal translocating P-type ATPase [Puniceibacterium sediminis]SNR84996.1 ATPase, P-type (transporting), HAD superfamily, subfamily IC/heavy metal translocating P-type ATPase [Puniceibacterium sediminis]